MSVRNLTLWQMILCLVMLDGVILTFELFGELPASAMLALSSVVNLLMGREDPPRKGPSAASLAFARPTLLAHSRPERLEVPAFSVCGSAWG